MFWRFGGYANISTIDTILDKPDFTLEELLEESDLIQELKQHNSKLIEYLREDAILERLLEYATAPRLEVFEARDDANQDDDEGRRKRLLLSLGVSDRDEESEKKRNRYAFVACEILSSDTWSIYEALSENRPLIRDFWKFLQRDAPLDPLQASYFTKINESLFEKKTGDMMELLRSSPDAVSNLLKHVECPMIMDLLLKIIALDRSEAGHGIVEWLYCQDIIPKLLSCLDAKNSWVLQTAAGDFIKAIITISANASQNEQQCIGPNELTRQLVSRPCVEQLIGYMLGGGNPLTVGVGIVIEVIRKNNSDYDPDMGSEANSIPSAHDPIYLGNMLRLFAENVPKFMDLIMNPPTPRKLHESTFGEMVEPLGFGRFKTCELMAELLHCSNMGLLNDPGAEQLIASRDMERQRLRREGRLGMEREDESSVDDLTMRSTHLTHDEFRRLEVTNADDDGFEEVEPSREMNDDTSHEFVKTDDDDSLPPHPTSFERDLDDSAEFVDEPLSSPRLTVAADKITEQQTEFEEPDLMVPPLSPTKPRPARLVPTGSSAKDEKISATAHTLDSDETEREGGHDTSDAPIEAEKSTLSEGGDGTLRLPIIGGPPTSTSTSISKKHASEESSTPVKTDEGTLSPHPEDLPAPLFSAPSAPESGLDRPPQFVSQLTLDTSEIEESTQNTDVDASQAAPFTDGAAEDQSRTQTSDTANPVVGDFLKQQFVEYRVVPTILSFFFGYPWNNFLHNVVYDIVQQVFNGPMDCTHNPVLAVSLFEAADITSAIIKGQKASDESHARTKTRMGYMGHLTLIAEEVVKFTERHPPEFLSENILNKVMTQEWVDYVEGALAETRERDNAILGGVRPELTRVQRASLGGGGGLGGIGLSTIGATSGSGSNALAEAGLNGGIETNDDAYNGTSTFSIGPSNLVSGFGSSSDEDDDEDDEDVNSEFRAYADPLNSSSSALAPPSIPPPPPPPPPLNIPPSRARRQLAARLAMQQKNNQEAAEASSSAPPRYDYDTYRQHDKDYNDEDDDDARNPFADDGDDFDDDDDDDDEADDLRDDGRGSWWRNVVRRREDIYHHQQQQADGDSEDGNDDDDDEEFGEFTMAEGQDTDSHQQPGNLVLKPIAVNPSREGNRGLSGLWPFGTRNEKESPSGEHDDDDDNGSDAAVAAAASVAAVEVVEATRRTSIEDADDEVVV